MVDYEEIGRALGVKSIRKVDPYKIDETMEVLKEEMDKDEPSLVLCVDAP
jgi:indolepyruvate ferredoxin oxidoreductase alpha subunit